MIVACPKCNTRFDRGITNQNSTCPNCKIDIDWLSTQPDAWFVGFHDRGMGHGDYGIIDKSGQLIAKVVTGRIEDAILLAAAPALAKACEGSPKLHKNEQDVSYARRVGEWAINQADTICVALALLDPGESKELGKESHD